MVQAQAKTRRDLIQHQIGDAGPARIAFVLHAMKIGGAERSVARMINSLDHDVFQMSVICLTTSGQAATWIENRDVSVLELHKKAGSDRAATNRLADALADLRIDIVHSHNWGTLLESTLAARRAGVPVHVHAERGTVLGTIKHNSLKSKLRGIAAGWALRRCDAVVTNAFAVADRVERHCWYPKSRITVIPNGVARPVTRKSQLELTGLRQRLGISPGSIVVGSVGRLVKVKGFEIAVQAIAKTNGRGIESDLLLVGDGPERAKLEALAAEAGIAARVHFLGHRDDVGDCLAMMDLYVNTSYSEGMSQSLVEALAMGLPLIATDVGDSAEVIGRDRKCGVIVQPGRPDELAQAIAGFADRSVWPELSIAAKKRHEERYQPGAMAAEYSSLYKTLLERRLVGKRRRAGGIT